MARRFMIALGFLVLSASAQVLTIQPNNPIVGSNGTQQFTSSEACVWFGSSLTGAPIGTISSTGLYQAPPTTAAITGVFVGCRTTDGRQATTALTVVGSTAPAPIVTPSGAGILVGQKLTFKSTQPCTQWRASRGSIDTNGVYRTPGTIPAPIIVTIGCQAAGGTATVELIVSPLPIPGSKGDKGDTGNTGAQGIPGQAGADSTVPGPQGPAGVCPSTCTGTGSGGPILSTQLLDLQVTYSAPTELTVGAACSVAAPCNVGFGSYVIAFATPVTVTILTATQHGTAYIWLDNFGVINVGIPSTATASCTGSCMIQNGVEQFGASGKPLASWPITTNPAGWNATGGTDFRSFFSTGQTYTFAAPFFTLNTGPEILVQMSTNETGKRVAPPTTATDACQPGDWSVDASFHYDCMLLNTWVRSPVASW